MAVRRLTLNGMRWSATSVTVGEHAEPEWTHLFERCTRTRNDEKKGKNMIGLYERALRTLYGRLTLPPTASSSPTSLRMEGECIVYSPASTPADGIDDELRAIATALYEYQQTNFNVDFTLNFAGVLDSSTGELIRKISKENLFTALDLFVSFPCKFRSIVVRKPRKSRIIDGLLLLAKQAFSQKMRGRIRIELFEDCEENEQ